MFFEVGGSNATYPTSINDGGSIAGYYIGPEDMRIGFVRSSDGTSVSFNPPDANGEGTGTPYINQGGTIAGTFQDANNHFHGYIRSADGTLETFDVPGSIATFVSGINANGDVVGSYQDTSDNYHGFVRVP
jgi:hypothetical protein